jgi:hypothetical protein
MGTVQIRSQRAIQCPRPQNNKDIRGLDDIGDVIIANTAGMESNANIKSANFNSSSAKKKRHELHHLAHFRIWLFHKKRIAMQISGNIKAPLHATLNWVAVQIYLFVFDHPHLHACSNQENGKDMQNLTVVRHPRNPNSNHDAARHDHTQNAPNHHAVQIDTRHSKIKKSA